MTQSEIDRLISKRNRVAMSGYRFDELDRIDAKLRAVPPGQDNRVDLALGRSCAIIEDPKDWRDMRGDLAL